MQKQLWFVIFMLALVGCRVNPIPLNERSNYKIGELITAGDLKLRQGSYAEAESSYQEAWSIASAYLPEAKGFRLGLAFSHFTLFDPLDHLAILYLQTRNYNKAEELFKESLLLRNKHLNTTSIFRATARLGLGKLYADVGDNEKSLQQFREAEKLINRATTSYVSIDTYRKVILFQKFENYIKNRDLRKANQTLNKLSSAISGSAFLDASSLNQDQALYFEMKGRYHLLKGEVDKAAANFDKAKKIATTYSVTNALFKTVRSQALLQWKIGNIAESADLFNELMISYRHHVQKNFAAMTEYERDNFYQSLKEDFELFNSFVADHQHHTESKTWNGILYDQQLFSKALLLNEINKRKSLILSSNDLSLKSKLREWQIAGDELAKSYFVKQPDRQFIADLTAKIENLEREINAASDLLQTMNNEPNWRQVQEKLKDQEVALEIIRLRHFDISQSFDFTDSLYYIFLTIDAHTPHPSALLLKNGNDLESRVLPYYRNSMLSQQAEDLSYHSFWQPLSPILKNAKRIYISSDGVYNQISLSTLLNPNGKYVSDEIELVFVTNTKDLLREFSPAPEPSASLFGRPDYLIDGDEIATVENKLKSSSNTRSLNFELMEDIRGNDFIDLPKTENEINEITDILASDGWRVIRFLRDSAAEDQVKALDNPGILHIATHGFFRVAHGSHALVQSGLILAGVNNTNQHSEDGILTAYEATNLNLGKTFLVVLSACETGLGEVRNGEGVYGLQRGFMVAGARYILMSLWKVEDEATSELMTSFYKFWLEGNEIHKALKLAQNSIRKKYTHPYYWGGFILLGN